jgi:hypothetical protein
VRDHRPRDAERGVQLAQILDRRVGRRVAAIRRIRKSARRPEYMTVRIAGARRQVSEGLIGFSVDFSILCRLFQQ